MGIPLVKIILALGIAWGVTTFFWGLAGSFVLGPTDFYSGVIAIVLGYLIVLPITITACWRPRVSAVCLLISLLVLECTIFASGGLRYLAIGALIMGVPTAALVWGYAYVARVRQKMTA